MRNRHADSHKPPTTNPTLNCENDFAPRPDLDVDEQVAMRPDLVWYADGPAPTAVIDAKYKAEKPDGFPDADLYQMLAYCTALRLPVGHLVYARGNEAGRTHRVAGAGITIQAHTLDLSQSPGGLLAELDTLAESIVRASGGQDLGQPREAAHG